MAGGKYYRIVGGSKKKLAVKKKRKYNTKMTTTKGSGLTPSYPFPRKFSWNTKYVDGRVSLNPGVGGLPVTHVYSLNGLYDPDITGAGHQPIGFDQIMPMYDHYTVIGSRARISIQNTSTADSQLIILQLKDSNVTSTAFGDVLENGQCRWALLGPRDSGASTKTLTINCSPSKFFGRNVLEGDKYQGTVSSNPSDQVYLHVIVAPITATDTSQCNFAIELDFRTVMTEPKMLAAS